MEHVLVYGAALVIFLQILKPYHAKDALILVFNVNMNRTNVRDVHLVICLKINVYNSVLQDML